MIKKSNTPAPKGTDTAQWIAIVAIIIALFCGMFGMFTYVRSVDVVTSPERENELQAQINVQNTQIALLINGTLTPTPNGAPTQGMEVTPSPTPIVVIPATPTSTPASTAWECYFAGSRLPDGHVPGANRVGYAGRCNYNALTGEVSLQPYWEEVVNYDTKLPAGLSVNDVQKETFELLNDGMRVILIKRGEAEYYFVADSVESPSTLPFWVNSCVKYDMTNNVITFFHDDNAGPGGFNGGCTGIYKEYNGYPASGFTGENLFYIEAIQELEAAGYQIPDEPFVVDEVWFEKWPQ